MSRDTLLFYHLHTPASNRFERVVRGLDIRSHATDIAALARRLPANVDAVFVKTDHWLTDPSYFQGLATEIDRDGGSVTAFDSHLYFELDGTRGVVINGVETSVRCEKYHVTVAGLPLDDDATYHTLDLANLIELARRAALIIPAHAGLPRHRIPDDLLREIVTMLADEPAEVALGYPTGYPPICNRLSRNEVPFRRSLQKFARAHGVFLVPELDLHAVVPPAFAGCGLLPTSTVDALEAGSLPVEDILAADLVAYDDRRNGLTLPEFLRTYPTFLPLIGESDGYGALFRESLLAQDTLASIDFSEHAVSLP